MKKLISPKLISEFGKNALEVVRTQIVEFNGQPLLDVRIWILKDGEAYVPTKKGLSLKFEQVDSLKQAIDKATEEIEKNQTG